nr:hypothetical protein [Tanacetum cinerariifolium]
MFFELLSAGGLFMTSGGSDCDAEYALSRLLQRGTVAEYKNEFEMLIGRGNAYKFRRSLLIAHLIEARFEVITKKEKEQIIKKKGDVILSLQSELASHEVKGSLDADEDIDINEKKESVEEVVVSGGEALGVDEDESNRVISVLKDGGGEFDDRLDDINLDLSQDFMIRVLKSRDVSGGSLVGFLSRCIARRIMKCLVLLVDGRAATAKGGRINSERRGQGGFEGVGNVTA